MKKTFLLLISIMLITACSSDDDSNSNSNKLATPVLLTPSNNAIVEVDEFFNLFQWSEVENASQYLFQISAASDFSSIEIEETIQSNSFDVNMVDFENESVYYWRVRAFGQGFEESDYSQVFSFNVINDINNSCEFCLINYSGTFDATIDGENVSNRSMGVFFQPFENNLYQSIYTFNFGSLNNWSGQQFFITGVLQNGNSLIYENRVWNINGTTVTINGIVTFNSDFTTLTGEFTLTGAHSGTINFFATL
jgi:hypothetical protein